MGDLPSKMNTIGALVPCLFCSSLYALCLPNLKDLQWHSSSVVTVVCLCPSPCPSGPLRMIAGRKGQEDKVGGEARRITCPIYLTSNPPAPVFGNVALLFKYRAGCAFQQIRDALRHNCITDDHSANTGRSDLSCFIPSQTAPCRSVDSGQFGQFSTPLCKRHRRDSSQ